MTPLSATTVLLEHSLIMCNSGFGPLDPILAILYISLLIFLVDKVYSAMECDPKGPDPQSCSGHCNALWGRAPLYNIPWTRGECQKGTCVCTFNAQELNPLMLQTCDQKWCVYCSGGASAPATCPSQRSMAEQKIKAKISCLSVGQRFEVFKETYGRKYGSQAEERYRLEVFKANSATIDELQAEGGGNVSFGIGPYADRTSEEYRAAKGIAEPDRKSDGENLLAPRMLRRSAKSTKNNNNNRRRSGSLPPTPAANPSRYPSFRDSSVRKSSFRDRGSSLPPSYRQTPFQTLHYKGPAPQGKAIKDWRFPADSYPETMSQAIGEKECGACWAFAVVGAVEVLLSHTLRRKIMLSKQYLIDCTPNSDCENGGDVLEAIWNIQVYGLPTAYDYPYKAEKGRCNSYVRAYVKITDYKDLSAKKFNTEQALTQNIKLLEKYLEEGPIVTSIYAPKETQFYLYGVFDVPHCTNDKELNHEVVIVGHFKDAWIIRDSETSSWGLQGHFLVKKGRCGVGLQAYGGIVIAPFPQDNSRGMQQGFTPKRQRLWT